MTPFGLDFGTTNSVLAYFDGTKVEVVGLVDAPPDWTALGFDKVFPSVIAVKSDGDLSFGWDAKRQTGAKVEAVKRLLATDDEIDLGTHRLPIEEVTSLLFAGIKNGAAAKGLTFDRSVVTIPANSRGVARFRTKLCAGLAGIEVPAFVNEPTAAAMAHSFDADDDQTILVFDWGGGTLDVTVLETVAGVFIERASKGIQRLGGIDLDDTFAKAILTSTGTTPNWSPEDHALFRLEVELAKIRLSQTDESILRLPTGQRIEVTRSLFESSVRSTIEQTRGPITQCLADLRIDPAAIDHLVLVGGSSKIPLARQLVTEWIGLEPATGCDPMTAVAEGAAIASAIMAGQVDKDFFVSTEHALGTIIADDAHRLSFSSIIPRNHKLPARASGSYQPAHAGQPTVLIRVIEGDPDNPIQHHDNVLLKEWEVELDTNLPFDKQGFEMTYEYSVDGILHVTVRSDFDGKVMLQDDISFGISRDRSGLHQMANRVNDAASSGTLGGGQRAGMPTTQADNASQQNLAAINDGAAKLVKKIRGILEIVSNEERVELEALCSAVEASNGTDNHALEQLTTQSANTPTSFERRP